MMANYEKWYTLKINGEYDYLLDLGFCQGQEHIPNVLGTFLITGQINARYRNS